MITSSGAECPFYYEDFARGANRRECRALASLSRTAWMPNDCSRCAVPGILVANGSPRLELRVQIVPGVLGLGRRVKVEGRCTLHGPVPGDLHVGCPECNRAADVLLRDALG